jgi:hypothetical protein
MSTLSDPSAGSVASQVVISLGDFQLVRLYSSKQEGISACNAIEPVTTAATAWLEQSTQLLVSQWPRGGSIEAYREKVVHRTRTPGMYDLPCSYLLVDKEQQTCIG